MQLFNVANWYPKVTLSNEQLEQLVGFETRDTPYYPGAQPAPMPDKIFIEKEGNLGFEYSDEAPAVVAKLYDALNGFYSAQNYIELFYSVPEVFAPIHEIASRVADATWQLRKAFNDSVDYNNETFNKLFSQPNPFASIREFVYIAVAYEILTGKQLWYLNRPINLSDGPEDIVNWFNLPGHLSRIHMKKNIDPYSALTVGDVVEKYSVPGFSNGRDREFPTKDVLTCLNLNMKRGYDLNDCIPQIKGADKPIRNLIPVYEARGIIYIKRGALGFLVSKAKDPSGTIPLSDKEKNELEDEHNKTYGVTGNKRPFGISSANVDFVRTAMSIEELQPFDETLADALAIYAVLRVPPHLVPNKNKSTFNNADADMKAFYTNVIIPWAKKYADIWTIGMGWPVRRRYILPDYSHIDVLQENKKEKADVDDINTRTYLSQYKEGLITKNELLAALGKDGIGTDGDKYANDPANAEPFAMKAQVGTMTALQAILADAAIGEEAKKNILVIVFGFAEADAAKLVIAPPKPEPIKTDNNGSSQEGTGTQEGGGPNQLPQS